MIQQLSPDNKRVVVSNNLDGPYLFGIIKEGQAVLIENNMTLKMTEQILERLIGYYKTRYSRERNIPVKEVKLP